MNLLIFICAWALAAFGTLLVVIGGLIKPTPQFHSSGRRPAKTSPPSTGGKGSNRSREFTRPPAAGWLGRLNPRLLKS